MTARARRAVPLPPRMLRALTQEPAALAQEPAPGPDDPLRVAVVVSSLRPGGLNALLPPLLRGLAGAGHDVSVWLTDTRRHHPGEDEQALRDRYASVFAGVPAALEVGMKAWTGADVAVAAGWRCAPTVLRLPSVGARMSLVADHEPDALPAGADREWAAWTYRQGMPALCAGPWLAGVLADVYGTATTAFDPGVDHETYRALPTHRRGDLVLFHASSAPRRGLALGLLALELLHERRPEFELGLFGTEHEIVTRFPHTHGGVLTPPQLAGAYSAAAVGLSLSFTAPSAIAAEMAACGMPVVELSTEATRATYGDDVLQLAAPDPSALADALELLLDDLALRADRSRAGVEWVAARTWDAATAQVEAALRAALAGPASAA